MKWFDYYFDQLKCLLDITFTVLIGIGIMASFLYGLFILMVNNI